MKLKRTLSILMMFLFMTGAVFAEQEFMNSGVEAGKWTQDLNAAKQYASEKNLPLMVMFTGSDWCYWCRLMDETVFSDDAFFDFAKDKLVLVAIDYPKDKSKVPADYVARNEALGREFRVRGVPTYVILKSDGVTELGRLSAGKDKTPQIFIKEVQGVLAAN